MENRADGILDAIASPERRVQLSYLVEDWATFLSLDLSDRVRVELPTVESDAFIESIGLSIRRGGAYYSTLNLSLTDDVQTPVTPAPTGTTWEQFMALTGALGIQFEAGVNFVDLYENTPAEGTLTDSTTGQFTDDSIFWIERFRWITSSDSFQIHRGGSTVNAGTYLSGLADTWTLYILDEDDDQYIAIRANTVDNLSSFKTAVGTRIAGSKSARTTYRTTPRSSQGCPAPT